MNYNINISISNVYRHTINYKSTKTQHLKSTETTSSHIHQLIDAVNFHLQFPSTIESFIVFFVVFIPIPLISNTIHQNLINTFLLKTQQRNWNNNPPSKPKTISFLLMQSVISMLTNICQKSYLNLRYHVQSSLLLKYLMYNIITNNHISDHRSSRLT